MKVNLGCGGKILEGFLNIDSRPIDAGGVFKQADVLDLNNLVQDGSVEELRFEFVLSKIPRYLHEAVFKTLYLAMAPGGRLCILVPNFQYAVTLMAEGREDDAFRHLYGGHRYCADNQNKWFFTQESIVAMAEQFGFRLVEAADKYDEAVCGGWFVKDVDDLAWRKVFDELGQK